MTISAVAVAGLVALTMPAAAQDIPFWPITLIVPYTAGGGNDVMARIVADKMSAILRQPIVIENRGGAGWQHRDAAGRACRPRRLHAGARRHRDARDRSDALPERRATIRARIFAPVGLIATSALAVLVNPEIPAKTIPELLTHSPSARPASSTMRRPASAAVSISAPSSLPAMAVSSSPTSRTRAARRH